MTARTFRFAAFVALVFGFGSAHQAALADPPLTVAIKSCPGAKITGFVGDYAGGAPGSMRQFLGIPYAEPPTGNNRWQPPQATCWTGNRASFTSENRVCAQNNGSSSGEDCLYLNVFTEPTGAVSKRPVMVFIHGGSFTAGTARNERHNPVSLVKEGIVAVSINYRLGAFGFLAHPALDKSKNNTGMYALLDQQLALKWVKDNIAAFGGDPKNVTIFGQSAGGMSTILHLVSPLSKGLFHKAIIQSGAFYNFPTTLSAAESQGVSFAQSLGCPGTGAAAAKCLRKLDYKVILAKQSALGANATLLRVDNVVLPDTISNLFAAGKFQAVPVINGSTHDEMRTHLVGDSRFGSGDTCHYTSNVTPGTYKAYLAKLFLAGFVDQVAAQYSAGSTSLTANTNFAAARSDAVFHCTGLHLDGWLAAKTKTYAYEFNDTKAPDTIGGPVKMQGGGTFPLGAYHGAEMPYIFPAGPTVALGCAIPYSGLSAAQSKLARSMTAYWTSFAKTGNPNPSSGTVPPAWPRYEGASPKMMSLVAATPKVMTAASFDADHKCSAFWNANVP